MPEVINFGNIRFNGLRLENVIEIAPTFKHVITANAEFIVEANKNPAFRQLLSGGCVTFDGQIPFLASRLFNRGKVYEKISGSDLIYHICEYCRLHNKSVFLLGALPDVNTAAIHKLRDKYGITVDGYSPPHSKYPFPEEHNDVILGKVAEVRPDFLFVAFGILKQEFWIAEHRERLIAAGVKVSIGCGGTLDFVAGRIKRAPRFIQRIGLEGIYRFLKEPKLFRLVRLIKSLQFFRYIP
ncbi:WecB/TagA/CpsF family glycosyltransferase [Chitinophaga rhizosphaerae]|uniref:WecB/TagA/CpsF family glycosyltransferase n=1 Tax=Chitinophaga rhizosphaerae TaxID=1864947 RepID=UPI000F808A5A|nr:WecB/TagA/CpsF family glycosyltransferase [Chitinophaga rhizosphaerae]